MITYTLALLVGIFVSVLLYVGLRSGHRSIKNTRKLNDRYKRDPKIIISEKERELH